MAGLFVGGMLPFLFSSMAMGAVGRAAMSMTEEVRRQFRDIPELKKALELMNLKKKVTGNDDDRKIYESALQKAEHGRCVEISTQFAIKEMVFPGLLAISSPVLVGFVFGPETLGGLLAGVTVSGVLMAIFQSNAGGVWDNAKKMIEEGVTIDEEVLAKGLRHIKLGCRRYSWRSFQRHFRPLIKYINQTDVSGPIGHCISYCIKKIRSYYAVL